MRANPGLGTSFTAVSIACVLVALTAYGVWTVRLRRSTLEAELRSEEKTLAMVLRLALESALVGRDPELAGDVLERFTRPDRVHGIALRGTRSGGWLASASLAGMQGRVDESTVRTVMTTGDDQQLLLEHDGHPFLVHLVLLADAEARPLGVAEIWRDLSYIDVYVRQTALRLLALAVGLLVLLSLGLAAYAQWAISRPAARLLEAMGRVAAGDLDVSVVSGGVPSGEFGQVARSFDDLARSLREAKTALKQGQSEREALLAQLRHSERLATLGQVVAEVAHEVGTPLNVISGRSKQLMEWCTADPRAEAAARIVHEQTTRIASILNRLLGLTRERPPRRQAVDLLDLARHTADLLATEFERAGVAVKVAPGTCLASADPGQMQQVVVNLLSNALHASDRGGLVEVGAERQGAQVRLMVRDHGRGIDASVREKLFEPFVSTKPSGEGTGLGLPIVRSILRQHDGNITFRDAAPGTLFEALLPAADAAAQKPPLETRP